MGWVTFKTMTRLFFFFSLFWKSEEEKQRKIERETKTDRERGRVSKDLNVKHFGFLLFLPFSFYFHLLLLSFLLFSSLSSWINHIGIFSFAEFFGRSTSSGDERKHFFWSEETLLRDCLSSEGDGNENWKRLEREKGEKQKKWWIIQCIILWFRCRLIIYRQVCLCSQMWKSSGLIFCYFFIQVTALTNEEKGRKKEKKGRNRGKNGERSWSNISQFSKNCF